MHVRNPELLFSTFSFQHIQSEFDKVGAGLQNVRGGSELRLLCL